MGILKVEKGHPVPDRRHKGRSLVRIELEDLLTKMKPKDSVFVSYNDLSTTTIQTVCRAFNKNSEESGLYAVVRYIEKPEGTRVWIIN